MTPLVWKVTVEPHQKLDYGSQDPVLIPCQQGQISNNGRPPPLNDGNYREVAPGIDQYKRVSNSQLEQENTTEHSILG